MKEEDAKVFSEWKKLKNSEALLWVELCKDVFPERYVGVLTPLPHNMTLFGDGALQK